MSKILIDKSTVKLALEALNTAESDYGSPAWELGQEAITAIKEALAQPVQPAMPKFEIKHRFCGDEYVSLNDVRSAWPQPVQPDNTSKLYEELRSIIDGGSESFTHKDAVQYLKDNLAPLKWTPEDTAYRPGGMSQPEQEPVALEAVYETIVHWDEGGGKRSRRELARRIVSLYTTTPQRKPLTDEQAKRFGK